VSLFRVKHSCKALKHPIVRDYATVRGFTDCLDSRALLKILQTLNSLSLSLYVFFSFSFSFFLFFFYIKISKNEHYVVIESA